MLVKQNNIIFCYHYFFNVFFKSTTLASIDEKIGGGTHITNTYIFLVLIFSPEQGKICVRSY